jgi:filamentous hemagglutinin
VERAEGQLVMSVAERATYQQIKVGKLGAPGDEGGHLIASIFNGPGEAINLKAMNGNFNKGAFKKLENMLADAVASGKKVHVKIDVVHTGDKMRPDQFVIKYQIENEAPMRKIFDNSPGGVK